jgi:hypothetical protein
MEPDLCFLRMRILPLMLILIISACTSVKTPLENYAQYEYGKTVSYGDQELHISLTNPLHCPLRVWIFDESGTLQSEFDKRNPILLQARSDTVLTLENLPRFENQLRFSSRLGDPSRPVKETQVALPFPQGKSYKIIQGNNTQYTHNSDMSRYAIDFDLKIRDTIWAATDGYVVGVVDRYRHGGKGDQWKPFGNFITLYDPDSGLFTQYVHLVYKGSLVKVGDKVRCGQPIALSGKTGQTDVEHLHFNTLIPVNSENGLESIPVEFIEGYSSQALKRGDMVRN